MTSTYVPYSKRAPKTTHLPTLKAELERCREVYGRRSSQALEAYLRYSKAAADQGRPLDQLRTFVEDEEERFFAWTIAGVDGHTYWNGPENFVKNDGTRRRPIRWWWELRHGELRRADSVGPICGEANCITPEHAVCEDRSARRRIFTDEQLLGALQVWALQRGSSPSRAAWDSGHPEGMASATIMLRFGSWNQSLRSAGLDVWEPRGVTTLMCVRAIQLARRILNRWPSAYDLQQPEMRERLRAEGLPQQSTVRARLGGSWSEALRRAGKR